MTDVKPNPDKAQPSQKGGRDKGGKFVKGQYRGGPGNPLVKYTEKLRAALAKAVTREDVEKIAKRLIADAKKGDVRAVHELFDRVFGKANQPIEVSGGVQHEHRHELIRAVQSDPEAMRLANAALRRLACNTGEPGPSSN